MLQNYEIMDILPHKSAHKLAFNISFCHKTHIYALFMQYQQQIVHLGHLCMVRGAWGCLGVWVAYLIESASTNGVAQGGAGP